MLMSVMIPSPVSVLIMGNAVTNDLMTSIYWAGVVAMIALDVPTGVLGLGDPGLDAVDLTTSRLA